jgi:hypothetical protein
VPDVCDLIVFQADVLLKERVRLGTDLAQPRPHDTEKKTQTPKMS